MGHTLCLSWEQVHFVELLKNISKNYITERTTAGEFQILCEVGLECIPFQTIIIT